MNANIIRNRMNVASLARLFAALALAVALVPLTPARAANTLALAATPDWIKRPILWVMTRVLPDPAPARIRALCDGRVTAASCSGLSLWRRFCIP